MNFFIYRPFKLSFTQNVFFWIKHIPCRNVKSVANFYLTLFHVGMRLWAPIRHPYANLADSVGQL